MSDDSLAFCPTMYNRVFTWVETRAKSELRVRLVPLHCNHVEALKFFFLLAQILSIVVLNVKNLAFTAYSVCACVCVLVVVVGGGGGARRYNHSNIYHDPAIGYSITCVNRPRCWWGRGAGSGYKCILLGICVRYMSTDVIKMSHNKNKKTLKK